MDENQIKSRVLLADDAPFMRMMQKDVLQKNGYEVCGEAGDGCTAIELYRDLKPDIIILDIAMPNIDGLTVLREIKKENPEAKILMCSAMGQADHVVEAIKFGAADFIVKPFQADKLIAGIYATLNKKMPVIPDPYISDWTMQQRNYPADQVLSQNEIDEIILSYIVFAKNPNPENRGFDKLSGLKRGIESESEFDKMLAESETDVSFAFADLDMFKRVNDTYGHEVGDEVIKEISEHLKAIDAKKEVYRFGGEEFLVVFEGMPKEEAFLIMENVRKTIKGETCAKTSITISMGIATYPEDGTNWIELKRKAEGALYRAKASGRNKICLAKEEKLMTKTVHYTVEQLQRLKELSDERSIGEAALLREALDDLLKKYNAKKDVAT